MNLKYHFTFKKQKKKNVFKSRINMVKNKMWVNEIIFFGLAKVHKRLLIFVCLYIKCIESASRKNKINKNLFMTLIDLKFRIIEQ